MPIDLNLEKQFIIATIIGFNQAIWIQFLSSFKKGGDNEWHSVDETIIRVHRHGAGTKKTKHLDALAAASLLESMQRLTH